MESVQIKPKRRRFSKILIVFTILIQLIIVGATGLLLVTRGPFVNIRTYLIGTSMTTGSHQYIAKMLFTPAQIQAIIGKDNAVAPDQIISNIKPANYDSSDIKLSEFKANDGAYYAYLLEIKSPLRVKVAMTSTVGKVGQFTSQMARDHDAVAAINGGGFSGLGNATGTGAEPSDFIISGGKVIWKEQALNESAKKNVIALDKNGILIVGQHSLKELTALNVLEGVTFNRNTPLITNGKGTYKNAGDTDFDGQQPRTAIGQKQDGTILMLVMDGRRLNMLGATLYDIQKIMLDNGAVTAVNLDGGASSTLFYNGDVYNNPCGAFGERTVSSSFYVSQ